VSTGARRDRLRARLASAGLDALLVTHLANVFYLTGFTGSAGRLLVTADGARDVFATDGRYRAQAASEAGDLPCVVTRGDDWLPGALGDRTALGLESSTVSWDGARNVAALLDRVDVRPAPGHVEALRVVKDATEIATLARACALGDEAFADLLTWIGPGSSERAVARRLERTLVDLGADERAFPSIVAAGENGARPHHRPTERLLAPGDLVKLDFGARVDGYHSDMTRMVALGEVGGDLVEVFAVVRSAQQAGLDAVRAGASGGHVDAACRSVIVEAGYGDGFVHGTGHGVGLEIHEDPRIAAGAAVTLAEGAVVTVEPGVYLPGRGGVRIEDTVVVTEHGRTVLTTTPKDLAVV
jgi:Xaa-Pro aminopeptidase